MPAQGYQGHLEGAGVAFTVHVARVAGSAEHGPVEGALLELGRNGHAALLAGDGGAHDEVLAHTV